MIQWCRLKVNTKGRSSRGGSTRLRSPAAPAAPVRTSAPPAAAASPPAFAATALAPSSFWTLGRPAPVVVAFRPPAKCFGIVAFRPPAKCLGIESRRVLIGAGGVRLCHYMAFIKVPGYAVNISQAPLRGVRNAVNPVDAAVPLPELEVSIRTSRATPRSNVRVADGQGPALWRVWVHVAEFQFRGGCPRSCPSRPAAQVQTRVAASGRSPECPSFPSSKYWAAKGSPGAGSSYPTIVLSCVRPARSPKHPA